MAQNETDFKELHLTLEAWTREGRNHQVLAALHALTIKTMPRAYRALFAQIARRINQPLLSLKIMNPVVRSKFVLDEPPTESERLIYATTLTSLGCLSEAEAILAELDPDRAPEVRLYQSFNHFRRWDYELAIPLLKKYVSAPQIDDYARAVGRVNLIAALVSEDRDTEALPLIESVLEHTRQNQMWLLHGNALELLAQVYLSKNELSACLVHLEEAEKILKTSNAMYYFFVLKWRGIVKCLMSQDSAAASENLRELQNLRALAVTRGYWEGVRDIDIYLAAICKSEKDLLDVVRGTPFRSFKQRAEQIWKQTIVDGDKGEFRLLTAEHSAGAIGSRNEAHTEFVLDHRDLSTEAGRQFEISPLLLNAFEVLIRDRYRPVQVGTLFHSLFPGEFFDPYYSLKKVDNVVSRLRGLFREWKWPVTIGVKNNEIFLRSTQGDVLVRRYGRPVVRNRDYLSYVHEQFNGRSFTLAQIMDATGRSKSFIHRILRDAVEDSRVVTIGRGPARRYRFTGRRIGHKSSG